MSEIVRHRPTGRDVLRENLTRARIPQLMIWETMGNVNDLGVDGNYMNYLTGAFQAAQLSSSSAAQTQEAFSQLPTYSEYCLKQYGQETNDDEAVRKIYRRKVGVMTSIPNAVALDRTAFALRAIEEPSDPKWQALLQELAIQAEKVAHGEERANILISQR